MSPARLKHVAQIAPMLYPLSKEKGIEQKPDGTSRIFYAPREPIKGVQRQIHDKILRRVDFPPYLIGGLQGYSYRDNCILHTRARTVINLDINTFFESVTAECIQLIWLHFFGFSSQVSRLLTRLTTHRGVLPRGAPTSPLLANLVFWDLEPYLVPKLAESAIRYSRYVDDVALSSKMKLEIGKVLWANRLVARMFMTKGLTVNRDKTRINHSPKPLLVHNVYVHGEVPTVPKKVRREIRADAHNLARDLRDLSTPGEKAQHYQRVNGRISWLHQFHPQEARALWDKLPAPPL